MAKGSARRFDTMHSCRREKDAVSKAAGSEEEGADGRSGEAD